MGAAPNPYFDASVLTALLLGSWQVATTVI